MDIITVIPSPATPYYPILPSIPTAFSVSSGGSSPSSDSVVDSSGSFESGTSPITPPSNDLPCPVRQQIQQNSSYTKVDITQPPPKLGAYSPKCPNGKGDFKVSPTVDAAKGNQARHKKSVSYPTLPLPPRGHKSMSRESEPGAPSNDTLQIHEYIRRNLRASSAPMLPTPSLQNMRKQDAETDPRIDNLTSALAALALCDDSVQCKTSAEDLPQEYKTARTSPPSSSQQDLSSDRSSSPSILHGYDLRGTKSLSEATKSAAPDPHNLHTSSSSNSDQPEVDNKLASLNQQPTIDSGNCHTRKKAPSKSPPRAPPSRNSIKVDHQPPIFSPFGDPKDVGYINESIRNRILRGINVSDGKKRGRKSHKCGWIYILFTTDCSNKVNKHIKIGRTERHPQDRVKEWQRCQNSVKLLLQGSFKHPFDYFTIVESLVALELGNVRKKYECERCKAIKIAKAARAKAASQGGSPTAMGSKDIENLHREEPQEDLDMAEESDTTREHNEWYEIDVITAFRTIEKWRNWLILHEPYDAKGNLTPYWKWRLEPVKKQSSSINWERWTQPGRLNYYRYLFVCCDSWVVWASGRCILFWLICLTLTWMFLSLFGYLGVFLICMVFLSLIAKPFC